MVKMRLLVMSLAIVIASACAGENPRQTATSLTGGDPERGRVLAKRYGCHTCHTIPGVRGANAVVGPPLERLAVRTYIGGGTMNTPENLIRFIRHPQSVNPRSAMPPTPATEQELRDLAAFLYTLR